MSRAEAEALRKLIEREKVVRVMGMGNHGEDRHYVTVVFPGGAYYEVDSIEKWEQLVKQHRL